MDSLSVGIDTLSESLRAIQEQLDADENSTDEDDIEFFNFTQESSFESSLTYREQGHTQNNNSVTVFPETPESPVVTTPPVTSQSFIQKGNRTPVIDPFLTSSDLGNAKRKSPQSSSPINRQNHRTVISAPNEDSPKRFKSNNSSSSISSSISFQSPKQIQQQSKRNNYNTPSPPRESFQQLSLNYDSYEKHTNEQQLQEQPQEQRQQQNEFAIPQYPSVPEISKSLKLGDREYLVFNRIGAGASSQVYSAYSLKDEKCYALKYIEIKRSEDRNNAVAEINLLKSLGSMERVAGLRYYYSIPRAIYLVMELGEIDLAHLIKKQSEKGWDFAFICYYWEQMLKAVNEIHSKNVVHCDLKPANFVLIKGTLKLIDFGISKAIQDDTTNIQKDSQIGTFNYMSPESFHDLNGSSEQNVLVKQGRASDIWALGCILYLMVYGHTPFSNIAMPQKIYCIMDTKYQIPFDKEVHNISIPHKVISTLKVCLERNKLLRPKVDSLLKYPLYEV